MPAILGLSALVASAAFTGVAIYINIAEQPARLKLDNQAMLAQWKPSYDAAIRMQASLAIVSGALGLAALWSTGDWRWAVGALLMLANWPYTALVILPVNRLLKATPSSDADAATRALIERWGRLHAVRGALASAATLVFLWSAA